MIELIRLMTTSVICAMPVVLLVASAVMLPSVTDWIWLVCIIISTPLQMTTGRKNTARASVRPKNFWLRIDAMKKLNSSVQGKSITSAVRLFCSVGTYSEFSNSSVR